MARSLQESDASKPRRERNSGRIYYDKSKTRWVAALTVEGKVTKRLLKSEAEAKATLKELTALEARGRLERSRVTLRAYAVEWLADVILPSRSKRTYQAYLGKLELHILPTLGSKLLADLKPSHVRTLLRQLAESGKRVKRDGEWIRVGLAAKTIDLIHAILHRLLEQALKDDLVTRNIMDAVEPPRVQQFEARPLSPDEARAVLEAMRGHVHEHLWRYILWTGSRFGEAAGLRRDYVDDRQQQVRLWWNLAAVPLSLRAPDDDWWEFKELKNRRRRTIPLSLPAYAAIRDQDVEADRLRAAAPTWRELDLVFPDHDGRPLQEKLVLKRWKRMLELAGLPICRIHDLRHTTAELALEQGAELIDVARLLGHRDVSITDRIYAGRLPASTRRAADRVADALGEITTEQAPRKGSRSPLRSPSA